jgi:hypothetical protein
MPDSQLPPIWGPSYDERDLDALLSGKTWNTPDALRPVESTLDALRAAGSGRELSDEAAARAAYRAFGFAPHPSAPFPVAVTGQNSAVSEHTLVLPSVHPSVARRAPARSARHRRSRPVAARPRRPRLTVTGAAAGALIVVAAVVTGAVTGSIGELTSFVHRPAGASASAIATGRAKSSQGVMAPGAARDPDISPTSPKPQEQPSVSSPTASPATPGPSTLCREYVQGVTGFPDGSHSLPGGQAAWATLVGELGQIAGGKSRIPWYCYLRLSGPFTGKGGGLVPGESAAASVGGTGPADSAGSSGSVGPGGSVGSGGSAGGSGAPGSAGSSGSADSPDSAGSSGSSGSSGTAGGAGGAGIAGSSHGTATDPGQSAAPSVRP